MSYRAILAGILHLIMAISAANTQTTENPRPGEPSLIASVLSRSIVSFGGGLTIGQGLSADDLGYGFVLGRMHIFLNPLEPEGIYICTPSSYLLQRAGKTAIGDLRLTGIGWRGAPLIPWLGFDAQASLSVGTRRYETEQMGDWYIGIQPILGVYFFYDRNIDIGLSLEPMYVFLRLFGSKEVRNENYVNIFFYVSFKNATRRLEYPWADTLAK
jgi:hypothetical protein